MRTLKIKHLFVIATLVAVAVTALLTERPKTEGRPVASSISATLGAGVVVLRDGTLVQPSVDCPLSETQRRMCVGNAFFARTADGTVCLVTAGHVARLLPNSGAHYRCDFDIAVINTWAPGKFPGAENLPEFADYDRDIPVTFVAWNPPTNSPARVSAKFEGVAPEDRWPGQIEAAPPPTGDDTLPGSSGSPAFQSGKVVGVLVGGRKFAAKDDYTVRNSSIRFQPFSEKR